MSKAMNQKGNYIFWVSRQQIHICLDRKLAQLNLLEYLNHFGQIMLELKNGWKQEKLSEAQLIIFQQIERINFLACLECEPLRIEGHDNH